MSEYRRITQSNDILVQYLTDRFKGEGEQRLRPQKTYNKTDIAKLLGTYSKVVERAIKDLEIGLHERRKGRNYYSLDDVSLIRKHLVGLPSRDRDREKLQIISIANQKGGSGKSTLTSCLIGYLAEQGFRVGVVDMDAQATITKILTGQNPNYLFTSNDTTQDFLARESDSLKFIKTHIDNIDLIPATNGLADIELNATTIAVNMDVDELHIYLDRLGGELQRLGDDYDIIFIDTPPSLGLITMIQWHACTGIIMPVKASDHDLHSLATYISYMKAYCEKTQMMREHDFYRVLLSDYEDAGVDKSGNAKDSAARQIRSVIEAAYNHDIDEGYDPLVLPNAIPHRAAFTTLSALNKTPYDCMPSECRGINKLRDEIEPAMKQVLNVINQQWGR